MGWTSHGHLIPGTPTTGTPPRMVSRCGGPRLCKVCKEESAKYVGEYMKHVPVVTYEDGKRKVIGEAKVDIRHGIIMVEADFDHQVMLKAYKKMQYISISSKPEGESNAERA